MKTFDDVGFVEFCRTRNLVAEKYRSFYVRWLRRFLLSEFSAETLSKTDLVQCFPSTSNRTKGAPVNGVDTFPGVGS